MHVEIEESLVPTALPSITSASPSVERYPFCIVWTEIPVLSWLLPFLGHVGICDSTGRIHDFQAPYCIGVDRMLFGSPAKYWDISDTFIPSSRPPPDGLPSPDMEEKRKQEVEEYDRAVARATKHFRKTQNYNIFTNNCHSYVAAVLEETGSGSPQKSWNMFWIAWGLAVHGRYVSSGRFLRAHLPFLILVVVSVVVATLLG